MKARWQRIRPSRRLAMLIGTVAVLLGSAVAFAAFGLHSPADEPATAAVASSAVLETATPAPSTDATEPPVGHGGGKDCTVCHVAAHKDRGACTECHQQPGVTWAFDHPKSDNCSVCHTPPAGHYAGACATCHATNVPFETARVNHTPSLDCRSCHKPAHRDRGQCVKCHSPGASWAFDHPKRSDCASCHKTPAKHYGTSCGSCHTPGRAFRSAKIRHTAKMECPSCHKPGHKDRGACAACHQPGVSWSFRHPTRTDCASCHKAPAKHYGSTCSGCHRAGRAFRSATFRHTASLACLSCHKAGHGDRGACASCHAPGVSWAFRHPSRNDCASCHRAPASHYGSSCSSCHRIGRSFGSATFRHASIPGGEHSYRSFACANCHPSGYSSHSCAKCHDSASGPSEDD